MHQEIYEPEITYDTIKHKLAEQEIDHLKNQIKQLTKRVDEIQSFISKNLAYIEANKILTEKKKLAELYDDGGEPQCTV